VIAVERTFEVALPPEMAWSRLAEVERWPEWAPHITAVELSPPGDLGPESSGALHIRRLGRTTFGMTAWEPPQRWEWTGAMAGMSVVYDHQFARARGGTRLTWTVELVGALTPIVKPVFARVYGRNVDRAIPCLQAWIVS
jgi:carbon monoxide dehydrogenase subunit G